MNATEFDHLMKGLKSKSGVQSSKNTSKVAEEEEDDDISPTATYTSFPKLGGLAKF